MMLTNLNPKRETCPRRQSRVLRLLLLCAALLGIAAAAALGQETIHVGFDGPPTSGGATNRLVGYYVESRVSVSATYGLFTRRWPGDSEYPHNGTAYLQPGPSGGVVFGYGSGRRFTPLSVDLALHSTASLEPVTVQFVGKGYGGELMAIQEFVLSDVLDSQGRPAFQTFHFSPEFPAVWYLVLERTPLWSLDNLVVFIPEPSSGTLLMSGALGLWLLRRQPHRRPD